VSIFDFLTSTRTFEVNHKGVGLLFHEKRREKKVTAAINISNRHNGAQPHIVEWIKQTLEPEFIQAVDFKGREDLQALVPDYGNFEAISHVQNQRAKYIANIIADDDDERIFSLEEILVFTFTPDEHVMFESVTYEAHAKIVEFINTILNNTIDDVQFPITSLSILKECYKICKDREFRPLGERPPVWRLSKPESLGTLLSNHLGDLSALNLHSSATNYNAISAFGTGIQSKHFNAELITNTLGRNGRAIVIRKNGDFSNIAKHLNGQINTVLPNSDSINPFWGVSNPQKFYSLFVQFLVSLATLSREVADSEKASLSKAIESAFKRHGKETDLTKIVELLQNEDADFASVYKIYISGDYANLFNGEPTHDCSNAFTLFNVANCLSGQSIQRACISALALKSTVELSNSNSRHNTLFINEADSLLDDEGLSPLFYELTMTSRPHGISIVSSLNAVVSIQNNKTINTIFKNSAWTLVGKVNNDDLSIFEKENTFSDEEFLQMTRSTLLRHDKYVEVVIRNGRNKGKFKYYIDPCSYALFSHLDKYGAMVSNYASSLSLPEAISTVASVVRDENKPFFEK